MRIKIKYPNTSIGLNNAFNHMDFINKEYKSYTNSNPNAELVVLNTHTNLWYNK